MVIVPSIDLRHGKVVRLQQGDYARQLNYALDPLETAHKFAAAGARWMHIVDLDGAKAGQPVQTDLIASIIAKSGMTIQVGGGVREISHIDRLMQAGAERIVIGTRAMEDWNWFNSLVHNPVYSGRIVLALDARGGDVAVQGWTKSAGRSALDVAKEVSDWPLAAILYTD
ncbi:MAG: HisA/HisF-related TIM barrel protein, partial [Tepidisphaeraceae bacterium]